MQCEITKNYWNDKIKYKKKRLKKAIDKTLPTLSSTTIRARTPLPDGVTSLS